MYNIPISQLTPSDLFFLYVAYESIRNGSKAGIAGLLGGTTAAVIMLTIHWVLR